jgi:ABC-type lipoprotein export system ATPase subunit
MSDALVELRDVYCLHRTREGDAAALQGTSLDVGRGELLCVLGPSGAGKTTLLRVIAGLQPPSAGVVSVLGRDVGRLPSRVRARIRHERIGFLGQRADAALAPELRVADAVALPLAMRGERASILRKRVDELLDAATLRDRADALPGELSGGERQRIALCASLAHRPELLLADEPTGELDDASAKAVRELIAELARAHRASVVIVSHDPATASIADRSVRMRDGRVVEDHRGGDGTLVVGRGGWLQLPPDLLAEAGIGGRARARVVDAGVMLTAAGQSADDGLLDEATPNRADRRTPWSPARVQVSGLVRGHGRGRMRRVVLERFSASIAPGRMTAVTGRSGAGKTTLLRLLCGLDRPDAGEVLIDGNSLRDRDAEALAELRRGRIGYLPQEPSPIGFLSAEENVALALQIRGWEPGEARQRAAVALAQVGLGDRSQQRVSRLSAGEGQRVALARALAAARGLLIVDEPTSRLDEANAAAVAELLVEAAAVDGQTVVCATHDLEVIRQADELVALTG